MTKDKPKVKARTSFYYRGNKLVSLAKGMSNGLRKSEIFKGEWLGCPTNLEKFDRAIAECDEANVFATMDGGNEAKVVRDVKDEILRGEMTTIAHFVSMKAGGNEQILRESGVPLMSVPSPKSSSSSLPPVVALVIKHAGISGLFLASWARVPGNCSYVLQACTGDPNVEANWAVVTVVGNASNIKIPNCEPGKRYYFRLQVIAPDGTRGSWSQVVSIIAL